MLTPVPFHEIVAGPLTLNWGTFRKIWCQHEWRLLTMANNSCLKSTACLLGPFLLFVGAVTPTRSQDKPEKPKAERQDFPKRCNPKLVRKPKPVGRNISLHKGEKPTGYGPLVTFQIAESGEVINIQLKRSSGFKGIDNLAVAWVKSSKYNSRPGCPVIEVEESVMVDF